MLISIVTPTYNSEEYLEDCILSIKNQKARNFEHIIIDGGSTDSTLSIIRKYENTYPMKWISEPDNGMYDAIAKGFRLAKGEIYCWLNSDDMYMPWTCLAIEKIFKDKNVSWCTGVPAQINPEGILYLISNKTIKYPDFCIKKGWMDGQRCGCIQQESSFWRKDLYNSVGGIDIKYKLAGDYHLWHKFAQKEKLFSYNTVLAGFRVHSGQKSQDRERYYSEAHEMTSVEKCLNSIKFYRTVNFCLKFATKVHEIREII